MKWCYPDDNGGADVTHFKVEHAQFKKDKDRRSFVQYTKEWKLDAIMSADQFSKKIVGLNPGIFYCVRVYAKNVKGWGPPSALSSPIETLPSKPYWGDDQLYSDTNAELTEVGWDSVTVQFQSPEHNGGRPLRQFIFFTVESPPIFLEDIIDTDWKEVGVMEAPVEEEDQHLASASFLEVDKPSLLFSSSLLELESTTSTQRIYTYSYKLEGLKPDTSYVMRYAAENEVGMGTPSKVVQFKTTAKPQETPVAAAPGAQEKPEQATPEPVKSSGAVEVPLPGPIVVWKCPSNCITSIKEYCKKNPKECKQFCEDEMNCKCGSKLPAPSPSPSPAPSPKPAKPSPSPKSPPKVLQIKTSPAASPKPSPKATPSPTPSPSPSPSANMDSMRGYTLKFFNNGKSKVVFDDGTHKLIEN